MFWVPFFEKICFLLTWKREKICIILTKSMDVVVKALNIFSSLWKSKCGCGISDRKFDQALCHSPQKTFKNSKKLREISKKRSGAIVYLFFKIFKTISKTTSSISQIQMNAAEGILAEIQWNFWLHYIPLFNCGYWKLFNKNVSRVNSRFLRRFVPTNLCKLFKYSISFKLSWFLYNFLLQLLKEPMDNKYFVIQAENRIKVLVSWNLGSN